MATTLHNGATTASVPTAWVAVPERLKYFVQCFGVTGAVQFSNDGTNQIAVAAPSNGGPSVQVDTSGGNQTVMIGNANPFPFAFMRFLPASTVASATITVSSV